MNKKTFLVTIFLIILIVGTIHFVHPEGVSYCCEKTTDGAWCQNAEQSQCMSSPYLSAPTSCESTSYCKLGTCINSQEGTCLENTPKVVCENNHGVWSDKSSNELPQCRLGCCLIGDQAAYVTQTRCKRLSSFTGVKINFRKDIQDEFTCIASATSEAKGACVFEKNSERTCKMTTKKQCLARQQDNQGGNNGKGIINNLFGGKKEENQTGETTVTFHEGYLCSATSLGTNCGPRGGTTCVKGKDQVYFIDTCGQIANIYDYSKRNDENYWTYIKDPSESCGAESENGNANSKTCGNCDYYAGSTCQAYRKANAPRPKYGNYICKDLSCEYKGKTYKHGEVWCDTNTKEGLSQFLPGSESFRLLCYDGEVTVEPCDPWRASVCVQSEVNGFKYAACQANKWQYCTQQDNEKDCENTEKRDCKWIEGYSILRDDKGNELKLENTKGYKVKASCVPKYSPGFNFWESQSQASQNGRSSESTNLCNVGTYSCVVKYRYNIFMDKDNLEKWHTAQKNACVENCKCLPGYNGENNGNGKNKCNPGHGCESNEEFLKSIQGICGAMGDCGVSVNYAGSEGYYDEYKIDFSDIQ